ncbi:MAG: hypothetical protein WAQ08_15350 [Aquabacterium sp.]|jgi:hypothetical protein|uniref:hypothetical protein n=1 Tax=Aquabacterium sp. TaxID=1872578 RepID=UPI003BB0579D
MFQKTLRSTGPTAKAAKAAKAALAAVLCGALLSACGDGDDPAAPAPTSPTSDTTPNAFSFTARPYVSVSAATESNVITVQGVDAATAITVAGGEYQIDGSAWTLVSGTVTNGQTVRVRHTSASAHSTLTTTTLSIGGVSAAFDTTTVPTSYVAQGGLLWTPDNNVLNWNDADSYCSSTTIQGMTGWRLPSVSELQSLQSSGAALGQGWGLAGIWSSNWAGTGLHKFVAMVNGNAGDYNDNSSVSFTCVHAI